MSASATSVNLAAALRLATCCYGGYGFAVFPADPQSKAPRVKGWQTKSTTEPEMVKALWAAQPDSLPAIDLAKCGLLAIDLDRHSGGPDGVAEFLEVSRPYSVDFARIPAIYTAGGGVHLIFRQPLSGALGNAEGALRGKGINVRGRGGYIIGAGAVRPDSSGWKQVNGTPDLLEAFALGAIPVLPSWLERLIKDARTLRPSEHEAQQGRPVEPLGSGKVPADEGLRMYCLSALANEARKVRTASHGARNNLLNEAAFSCGTLLPWQSIGRAEVEMELAKAGLAAGLQHTEVEATIKSGIEAGMAKPRPPLERVHVSANADQPTAELLFSRGSDPEGWLDPKPLPSGLSPVDQFDIKFLPAALHAHVLDVADRMQCPPDFVGVSIIVALGATIGRQVGIRPMPKDDWLVTPNLWGMIIGRPGVMKSPAMSEALEPLKRIEAAARQRYQTALKEYSKELQLFELRTKAVKSALGRLLADNSGADVANLQLPTTPEEPSARRLIASDATYEALGEILAKNPNGVLTYRDEIVALLKTLDREEYAAARGFFLTGWNGNDGYTFDRIIRGHQHIDAICLSVLGSTQPGRIASYIGRAVRGGEGDDGLIQRFNLLVWPDQAPSWRSVDRFPDTAARATAFKIFERCSDLHAAGVLLRPDDRGGIPFLRFEPAAGDMFVAWRSELEKRVRSGELAPALESHLAKYRKLVPALALINRIADGETGDVTTLALERAIRFADYLETHANRVYAAGVQLEVAAAKAIVARIQKGDLADGFTAREIHQRGWSNLTDSSQVEAALNLLVDLDHLKDEKIRTAGRPKFIYWINPKVQR